MKMLELCPLGEDFSLDSSEVIKLINALEKINWKVKFIKYGHSWNINLCKER